MVGREIDGGPGRSPSRQDEEPLGLGVNVLAILD